MEAMQEETSFYHRIIREICQEDGIDLTWLSSHWLAVMRYDGKVRHILGYKFDLNPAGSCLAADDKYATFEVLRQAGLPIIKHTILYPRSLTEVYVKERNTPQYIADFFAQYNQHIVIKANSGSCGTAVYQVTSLDQVPQILERVFHQSFSASLCPFYDIQHEYRVTILDGEVRLAYQKDRQGKNWKFNLSQGAIASQIKDKTLLQKLTVLAQKSAQAIGLRFCNVDIIETAKNELLIIEINSGVVIEHYLEQFPQDYEKAKTIYRDAIQKMFES